MYFQTNRLHTNYFVTLKEYYACLSVLTQTNPKFQTSSTSLAFLKLFLSVHQIYFYSLKDAYSNINYICYVRI